MGAAHMVKQFLVDANPLTRRNETPDVWHERTLGLVFYHVHHGHQFRAPVRPMRARHLHQGYDLGEFHRRGRHVHGGSHRGSAHRAYVHRVQVPHPDQTHVTHGMTVRTEARHVRHEHQTDWTLERPPDLLGYGLDLRGYPFLCHRVDVVVSIRGGNGVARDAGRSRVGRRHRRRSRCARHFLLSFNSQRLFPTGTRIYTNGLFRHYSI